MTERDGNGKYIMMGRDRIYFFARQTGRDGIDDQAECCSFGWAKRPPVANLSFPYAGSAGVKGGRLQGKNGLNRILETQQACASEQFFGEK